MSPLEQNSPIVVAPQERSADLSDELAEAVARVQAESDALVDSGQIVGAADQINWKVARLRQLGTLYLAQDRLDLVAELTDYMDRLMRIVERFNQVSTQLGVVAGVVPREAAADAVGTSSAVAPPSARKPRRQPEIMVPAPHFELNTSRVTEERYHAFFSSKALAEVLAPEFSEAFGEVLIGQRPPLSVGEFPRYSVSPSAMVLVVVQMAEAGVFVDNWKSQGVASPKRLLQQLVRQKSGQLYSDSAIINRAYNNDIPPTHKTRLQEAIEVFFGP